jgi:hypothetical protein
MHKDGSKSLSLIKTIGSLTSQGQHYAPLSQNCGAKWC